jgi:DNA-binding MarR family transcriptional regulator
MNLPLSQINGFPDLGRALGRLIAFTQVLDGEGVTPLEYQAMLLVKTWPGESITLGELARQLRLTKAFSLRLADRLVENDFAVRRSSPRPVDSIIRLSPHGGEVLADLAARHVKELHSLEPILTEALPRLRRS